MMWHLARHVDQGSLKIPRGSILLHEETDPQSDACLSASELLDIALDLCHGAARASEQELSRRFTFLEGHSGPLSLLCAILTGCRRLQVCTAGEFAVHLQHVTPCLGQATDAVPP
jgi:hypothetical protein